MTVMDQPVDSSFSVRVQADGTLVVPSQAVSHFGLKPGEAVRLTPGAHGRLVLSKTGGIDTERFERVRGIAKDMEGLSTDEFMLLMRGDPDW